MIIKKKCPCCGHVEDSEVGIGATIYIRVRRKRRGFQGTLLTQQARFWECLSGVLETVRGVLDYCPRVKDDLIYECKYIGTAEEVERKVREDARQEAIEGSSHNGADGNEVPSVPDE